MDTDLDIEHGRLLEALILERQFVEASSPMFTNFGRYPDCWNWYGGSWKVPPQWNPRGYFDIEYRNSENKLHRIYGPAYVSRLYGIEAWFKDGRLHREGGPAYTQKYNSAWFYEGKLHRLDGPAVIEGGGPKQYWIHGVRFSAKQYKWEIRRRKKKGR